MAISKARKMKWLPARDGEFRGAPVPGNSSKKLFRHPKFMVFAISLRLFATPRLHHVIGMIGRRLEED
jgi:hypothetical protein